jgi:hypothetical protein
MIILGAIAAVVALVVFALIEPTFNPLGGWQRFVESVRQVRIWQIAVAIAYDGLVFSMLFSHRRPDYELATFFVMVAFSGLFLYAWSREFWLLMDLGDADFRGRYDKPIWVFLLVILAPVSLFLFRSYRLAHWADRELKPAPETDFLADVARTATFSPSPGEFGHEPTVR